MPVKSRNFGKTILVLGALAVILTAAMAFLALRQEDERRRGALDFEAYQVLAGIMDLWNAGGSFDPSLWHGVLGFGMYTPSGTAVYAWGSAPESLAGTGLFLSGGETSLSGSTVRILRRAGTAPGQRGVEGRRSMGGGIGGSPMMGSPMMGGFPPGSMRLLYLELDVADRLRGRTPLFWLVSGLLFLFGTLVFMAFLLARRLEAYRERERETAHLVQLGEAARTLAHEIKNPLGIIRVQCATLRRTLSDERHKNLEVIEEEVSRLSLMTDRIRDFLQSSAGTAETKSARFYLEQCRRRWEGQLSVAPDGEVPDVAVTLDPSRLMQILDNLIANALEATPPGSPGPELSLSLRRGLAAFTVADRGPGIAEEHRKRLFQPFFTTKARGSGIGLALSRRYAEQAGGSLEWSERVGGGSLFTLSLPATGGKE